MQRTEVTVDVSKLIQDTEGLRYPKNFGVNSMLKKSGTSISYILVTEASARFINLFGLTVDVDSGDIALGYFPNSERYISIGNVYEHLRDKMFGPKVRDIKDSKKRILDSDLKFIIEDLKINPKYRQQHKEDIEALFKNLGSETKYDSIILNLVYERTYSDIPKYMQDFLTSFDDGKWIKSFISECIKYAKDMESVSRDFFNNFIAEPDADKVLDNSKMSLKELLEGRTPNLDTLIMKYLGYGIPIDLLLGLKSYGFGIKQRNSVYPSTGSRSLDNLPVAMAINVGERLSSLSYVEVGNVGDTLIQVYNIMDIVRAVDAESEILFSLEMIREKNPSLYTGISKRLGIDDALLDCKLSDENFITNLTRYEDRFLSLIDRGSMYSRNVNFSQYHFLAFSTRMLDSSGRIFKKAINRVMKKF